jgi:hypothetical protein
MSSFLNAVLRTLLAFPNGMAALNATHQLARLTGLARDTETLRVTKWLPAQEEKYNVATLNIQKTEDCRVGIIGVLYVLNLSIKIF